MPEKRPATDVGPLNAFVPLPRAWTEYRHSVSHSAQVVYIALLLAMRPSTGVIRAGVRQIAADAGLAPSTTADALLELAEVGVIERTERGRNQSQQTEYVVLFRRGGVPPTGQPLSDEQHSNRTPRTGIQYSDRTARGISPAETPPLDLSLDASRPLQEDPYEEWEGNHA